MKISSSVADRSLSKLAAGPCAAGRWMGAGSAPAQRGGLVVLLAALLQGLLGSGGRRDGRRAGCEQRAEWWTSRRHLLQVWCHLFPAAAAGLDLAALHTAERQGSPEREQQLPHLLPLFLLPLLHFRGMLLSFLFFCKREKHPFAFPFFWSWCAKIRGENGCS